MDGKDSDKQSCSWSWICISCWVTATLLHNCNHNLAPDVARLLPESSAWKRHVSVSWDVWITDAWVSHTNTSQKILPFFWFVFSLQSNGFKFKLKSWVALPKILYLLCAKLPLPVTPVKNIHYCEWTDSLKTFIDSSVSWSYLFFWLSISTCFIMKLAEKSSSKLDDLVEQRDMWPKLLPYFWVFGDFWVCPALDRK